MNLFDAFFAFLARLFNRHPTPAPSPGEPPDVVKPRVLVINIDPIVDAQGTRLTTRMGWNRVDDLIQGFIADIAEVSYGLVQYQYDPANRIDVDEFPQKNDGFQYTPSSYLNMMVNEKTHHEPDGVDYQKIIDDYHLISKVMSNQVDEVWVFGAPYFGFYESNMVGKGAIWCNSSPCADTDLCTRRFVIMGFNYQRGIGEMLHDIGHRMESIMAYVYHSFGTLQDAYNSVNPNVQPPVSPTRFMHPQNDFERFMLFEKIAPGRAEVGLIHTPPNGDKDYDWQNSSAVSSNCDDWLNYPTFQGTRRMVNCHDWECSPDGYAYTKWWLRHAPHVGGSQNGVLNNWWKYTMQVDQPF